MPDKFPEAFDRYEQKEKPKEQGITTFQELLTSYSSWQRYRASAKQVKAMSQLSESKLGIKPILRYRYRYTRTLKSGEVRNYEQTRWRDVKSGRFAKPPI